MTDFLSLSLTEAGEPASIEARANLILEGLDKTDGLFVTVQNIYMVESARDAHLILPAAQWGEADNISLNCNSRLLRLDERFMDPPGEAKPDWEIHALIGQRLEALYTAEGRLDIAKRFSGMNWTSGADVVKAIQDDLYAGVNTRVPASEAGTLDPESFKGVDYAYLRKVGQTGIQTPVRMDPSTGGTGGHRAPLFNLEFHDPGREVPLVRHAAVGPLRGGRHGRQLSGVRSRKNTRSGSAWAGARSSGRPRITNGYWQKRPIRCRSPTCR